MRSFALACGLFALMFALTYSSTAQQETVYTATVIPAVARSGGSTTIRIQIISWTTDAERAQLKQVFAKDGNDKGMALLRSMAKGHINVAGQSGRKIFAAFTLDSPSGKRIIIVTEHILSEYEKTQNIQFDAMGHPQSGEVYPAARVTVTPDGFVDVDTQTPDTATMIDIARAN